MKRFLSLAGFSLGSVLLMVPVAMTAKNTHTDKRYYDQQGKDYHVYNSQEDRAYRVYLGEQHQSYREFRKAKPAQQQQYFKWRHEHPDNVLFKVQVR